MGHGERPGPVTAGRHTPWHPAWARYSTVTGWAILGGCSQGFSTAARRPHCAPGTRRSGLRCGPGSFPVNGRRFRGEHRARRRDEVTLVLVRVRTVLRGTPDGLLV